MTDNIYEEIDNHIKVGTLTHASKEQLERYATALCETGASTFFGSSFQAICGTIRTLIIIRMSEATNRAAKWFSIAALFIALLAFACGFGQVIFGIKSLELQKQQVKVSTPSVTEAPPTASKDRRDLTKPIKKQ